MRSSWMVPGGQCAPGLYAHLSCQQRVGFVSDKSATGWPSIARIMSFGSKPAAAAGLSLGISTTRTPRAA
jgi:hypothetical protein